MPRAVARQPPRWRHSAVGAEWRYAAGDPDRWRRRFECLWCGSRVYSGTPDQCRDAITNAQHLLGVCPGGESSLDGPLTDLYAKVAKAAPRARIVVTGYPQLFEPPAATDPKAAIKAAINDATTDLNCVIERSVAATQATDVNITYVDVTEEFAGHGIDSTNPFIHDLFINNLVDPEAFHPNADGYRAYAKAIKTKLPGGWLDKPLICGPATRDLTLRCRSASSSRACAASEICLVRPENG
jgi:hypothetical protein